MNIPMREKYVDEAVGVWVVFGYRKNEQGVITGVDVVDQKHDVFENLPPEIANKVVEAHDKFREQLYKILCEPEAGQKPMSAGVYAAKQVEQDMAEAIAILRQPPAQDGRVDDLAMLVRRLVHALSKAAPDHALSAKAVDYLQRKGLQGSPLRDDDVLKGKK